MKALSLDPKEAIQIALEDTDRITRKYSSDYRGPVLLCSKKACATNGTIPGRAICIGNLTEIIPDTDGNEWIFSDIKLIKPIEARGKQRLFEIDVDDSDLNICNEIDVEKTAEWLEENFLPYVKGAKQVNKGEWEVSWPFEL